MKKKLKKQKITVESRLRTRITELESINADKNNQYAKLLAKSTKSETMMRALFVFVHKAIAGISNADRAMRDAVYAYDQARIRTVDEMSVEEISAAIMQAFLALSKDFAREDEGTLLMQEHKNDLMVIIRGMIDDTTRPDDRRERLAGVIHNLEMAKKNGHVVNLNRSDDQYYKSN